MTAAADPVRRFSGRAKDYARARPGYPPGLLDILAGARGLAPSWVVADLGSGTGRLSEIFLAFGCTVLAVEPNPEMRAEAERQLAGQPRFASVDGRAEATGLPDRCADVAVAGQAFHWFDPAGTRAELGRILRGRRPCAVVWNTRAARPSGLAPAWEEFLRQHSRDYLEIEARQSAGESALAAFFDRGQYARVTLPNSQVLDREGLRARYLSCSYALAPGDSGFEEAMRGLDAVFDAHARGGTVTMEYETTMCHGEVGG